jgi:hypothetical protein
MALRRGSVTNAPGRVAVDSLPPMTGPTTCPAGLSRLTKEPIASELAGFERFASLRAAYRANSL